MEMRKLLIIGAAVAALSATPALAIDSGTVVGGTAGGFTGGTIGFFLGGPIGAFIGGWTGAAIGASVLSDDVVFERGGSVTLNGRLGVGDLVDDDIRLRRIDGDDQYGYFRANGAIYVVDLDTREIVEIRLG
jgi:hypothetical protein